MKNIHIRWYDIIEASLVTPASSRGGLNYWGLNLRDSYRGSWRFAVGLWYAGAMPRLLSYSATTNTSTLDIYKYHSVAELDLQLVFPGTGQETVPQPVSQMGLKLRTGCSITNFVVIHAELPVYLVPQVLGGTSPLQRQSSQATCPTSQSNWQTRIP